MMFPLPICALESGEDRSYMEQLYIRYHSMMYKKALAMMKNHHDAEDVVDAVVVKLIDKLPLLKGLDGFTLRSYILSAVRNTAISRLRRQSSSRIYDFADAGERIERVPDDCEVDTALLRAEDIARMTAAIARLSERERDILRMAYYDEMSARDIAETMRCREGTIRSILSRARAKALRLMREAEGEKPERSF